MILQKNGNASNNNLVEKGWFKYQLTLGNYPFYYLKNQFKPRVFIASVKAIALGKLGLTLNSSQWDEIDIYVEEVNVHEVDKDDPTKIIYGRIANTFILLSIVRPLLDAKAILQSFDVFQGQVIYLFFVGKLPFVIELNNCRTQLYRGIVLRIYMQAYEDFMMLYSVLTNIEMHSWRMFPCSLINV